MLDKYYTPPDLISKMLDLAHGIRPKVIADFAVGDGAILCAANKIWPDSMMFGNDICKRSNRLARRNLDGVAVSNCNIFSHRSCSSSGILRNLVGKCDLVLLNPPYSYRGAFRFDGSRDFSITKCPKALAFTLCCLKYLSSSGLLIALLPTGSVYGSNSTTIIEYLKSSYSFATHEEFTSKAFRNCTARTVIISISLNKPSANQHRIHNDSVHIPFKFYRGPLPTYRAVCTDSGVPFYHSTSLKPYGIFSVCKVSNSTLKTTVGPVVLVQRVGNISMCKVAAYEFLTPSIVSDCLFVIETTSISHSIAVRDSIYASWTEFASLYTGTCAKHITSAKLKSFLNLILSNI